MAVRKIALLGNPILRTKCNRVKDCSSKAVQKTIRDLRDTLDDFRSSHGFGRGIAAPQISSKLKIIFIRLHRLGAFVNPKITKHSRQTFMVWDDCFSFPDLLVRVQRYRWIDVSYVNEKGKAKTLRATNALSELLQHEIDHTNGILAVDRARSTRHVILRSEFRKAH